MKRRKTTHKQQISYFDDYTLFEYKGTQLRIYNNGVLIIKGNSIVKHAAYALAKNILDSKGDSISTEYNRCIVVKTKTGKPYTVKWIGLGILLDDALPEPKFWEEFKTEFERFCELKAFL